MRRLPPVDQWLSYEPDGAGSIISVVPGVKPGEEDGRGVWQRMYVVETVQDGTVHARAAYVVGEDQTLRFDQHPELADNLYESLERLLVNELNGESDLKMAFNLAGLS